MFEALFSLALSTLALLGSPGPATLALAAVGASCGVTKGLPFLYGILAGLSVVIVTTALGLSILLISFPNVYVVLQVIGALYIFYIAFKLINSPLIPSKNTIDDSLPRFVDGFFVNLLNPKAYVAFMALFSQFILPFASQLTGTIVTAVTCFFIAIIIDGLWLISGGLLRNMWADPRYGITLRVVFAVLMIIAVIWAFLR